MRRGSRAARIFFLSTGRPGNQLESGGGPKERHQRRDGSHSRASIVRFSDSPSHGVFASSRPIVGRIFPIRSPRMLTVRWHLLGACSLRARALALNPIVFRIAIMTCGNVTMQENGAIPGFCHGTLHCVRFFSQGRCYDRVPLLVAMNRMTVCGTNPSERTFSHTSNRGAGLGQIPGHQSW